MSLATTQIAIFAFQYSACFTFRWSPVLATVRCFQQQILDLLVQFAINQKAGRPFPSHLEFRSQRVAQQCTFNQILIGSVTSAKKANNKRQDNGGAFTFERIDGADSVPIVYGMFSNWQQQ